MRKRRALAAIGIAAGLLARTPDAVASEKLLLSSISPPNHWSSTEGFVPFMACVKTESNGEIDFSYFPSSQIASATESLDAVNKGLAQISYLVISALSNKMPLSGISMLPNMGDTSTEMAQINRQVLEAEGVFLKEFISNRVYPLIVIMTPPYQIMARGKPMDSLDAIAGKKVSASGGALLYTLKSVGAVPVEIGGSDAYMALQQGVVDGSLLAIPSVAPYKLQEVLKSISTNGAFGSAAGILSIDAAVWQKLSPKNQKIMKDCGLKAETHVAKYLDDLTARLKVEFAASGVRMYEFTPETRAVLDDKLRNVADEYVNRLQSRGIPAREAYETYLKALGR